MSRAPLSRQIIVSGRISDALSGGRPVGVPQITVSGPRGLLLRVTGEGVYAVSAQPDIAMPVAGDRISLLLRTDGYQETSVQVQLTPADLERTPLAVDLGGEAAELSHFANLPIAQDIALLPRSVALKGRVGNADDPAGALGGTSVRVTAPVPAGPVQTDALGFFSLPALPVAAEITLRIEAAGFDAADILYRPDFSQPINHGAFALSSI
ncbi:MAG: hypothetical protein NTW20_11815 [Rhodobacterales bacterium]|nr:hypothetical protein [Rhodobacterales bacterium]